MPDIDLPEDHDPDHDYDTEDHVRALRLILASLRGLRQDWPTRDQILEEIGECPDCLRAVVLHLAAEAATAYIGPPEETPQGWKIPETQQEEAIGFISDILADVLDHQPG